MQLCNEPTIAPDRRMIPPAARESIGRVLAGLVLVGRLEVLQQVPLARRSGDFGPLMALVIDLSDGAAGSLALVLGSAVCGSAR
jgi:hypothetical protein